MTRQLRLVAPGAPGEPAGAAFDLLVDALAVRSFTTHDAIITEPEPSWLGRIFPGRRLDVGPARRLFLDMLAGRGVVCVLAGEPSLRLETSWDGVFYADIPDDRLELEAELRKLGLQVDESPLDAEPEEIGRPADDAFWARASFPALVHECWAGGVLGERWLSAESEAVRSQPRPRSTVAVHTGVPIHRAARERLRETIAAMGRLLDTVVLFPPDALAAARTLSAGIEGVGDDDLPPYGEIAFFFPPEERDEPGEPEADGLVAVVPDADGVVRAPLSC